jgi:hypothetical protein
MPKPVIDIQPPHDNGFNRRMARGHELRRGHPLEAVQVTSDGTLWHRVNRCCGEAVPAEVKTWDEEIAP